jgi:hypothetical protein
MTTKFRPDDANAGDSRKQRLAEQLRANLQRRKQQARSRRTGQADERPEGIAAPASSSENIVDEVQK